MGRTPGVQAIYPSEVFGALLASHFSPPGSRILLDNQGAVNALTSTKKVVRHAFLIDLAKASTTGKQQKVQWIKGHATSRGNHLADTYARQATTLPPQTSAMPTSLWDVVVDGMRHSPPHKCWTERNIPTHRHTGIHPISFTPLRKCPESLPWIKWLFGLRWRPGWDSYQSFWKHTPSRRACPFCHSFHNASIHGTLAFCASHPLRNSWLKAWGRHPLVAAWVQTASKADLMLLGKVCIPTSLYESLSATLGRKGTRQLVFSFQGCVLPLLDEVLDTLSPLPPQLPKGKRKRIWMEEDWLDQGQGVSDLPAPGRKAQPNPRPITHFFRRPPPNPSSSAL